MKKLNRMQLRRLIEARIKPTTTIPGMNPSRQEKLDVLASRRDQDVMGREFADNSFDAVIDPFRGDDVPFSRREFQYDHPLVEDPNFKKNIADLFDIFMYEHKVFANDIEDGMPVEEYKNMCSDFFIELLPEMSTKPGYFTGGKIPASISHTFSTGKVPYQLEEIIKRIIDPMSEKIWNDWNNDTFFS